MSDSPIPGNRKTYTLQNFLEWSQMPSLNIRKVTVTLLSSPKTTYVQTFYVWKAGFLPFWSTEQDHFFTLDVQMVIDLKSTQNPITIALSELQYSFSVHTASCKENNFSANPFRAAAEATRIWVSIWWMRYSTCMDHTTISHIKAFMSACTHVCTSITQMYLPPLPTPSIQVPVMRPAKN